MLFQGGQLLYKMIVMVRNLRRRRTDILDVGESTLDVGETTRRRNDRPLPLRIPYKKTSSLLHKDKVIRKCMVHYSKKNVPSSSELRKCLSLAFGK